MEQTKLNRLIDDLRSDVDMLLNNHYDLSESGVAGMRENISQITTKIESIQKELTQTHEQAIITAQNLMAYDIQYTNHTERAYSLSNDLEQYFKDFLEYFLNATEKTKDYDLEDRIKVLKPVMTKVRDHLDNLVNGDGSQISSADFEELSSTVDDLQDTCQSLEAKYTALQQQVNKYVTPKDPYYIGKSFTDYPAGTIVQTYDYEERVLNITSKTLITSPTYFFSTEQSSTGTIKLTHKVKTENAVTVKIKTFINQTQFNEQSFVTEANVEKTIEIELFDCNFNTESKANNIYTTIVYESSYCNMYLTYQKVEITAPNARMLHKIIPFNAFHFNNKYYLTDCSTGTLRTAEIEATEMHNMDNLTWVNTNIPAIECAISAFYITNSDATYSPNKICYFRRTIEDKYYAGDVSDGINILLTNATHIDTYSNSSSTPSVVNKLSTYKNNNYFSIFNPNTNKLSTISLVKNENEGTFYSAAKFDIPQHTNTSTPIVVRQDDQGNNTFGYFSSQTCQLVDGINSTLIMLGKIKDFEYTANIYIKHYDKIIKQKAKCTAQNTYELISSETFGTYDKVFEMPNNDYFAIKNKQLLYYKLPTE